MFGVRADRVNKQNDKVKQLLSNDTIRTKISMANAADDPLSTIGKRTVASFIMDPEVTNWSRNHSTSKTSKASNPYDDASPIRSSWVSALSDAAKAVNQYSGYTSSDKKSKYAPRTLGKYERAVKQDKYAKLREIASTLRDYDNDRKRFGDRAKFPKFAGIDYEKLSPAEKAIVDRLRR